MQPVGGGVGVDAEPLRVEGVDADRVGRRDGVSRYGISRYGVGWHCVDRCVVECGQIGEYVAAEVQLLQLSRTVDGDAQLSGGEVFVGDVKVGGVAGGDGFHLFFDQRAEIEPALVAGKEIISLEIIK